MTGYVKASELVKKPVVTFGGEDIAQIKDVVFEPSDGSVRCFTLAGRGLFSGPLKKTLAMGHVHALGQEAVMIRDETALAGAGRSAGRSGSGGSDVLGARAMTEDGRELGKVVDVVIETGLKPVVAGYEVESSGTPHRRMLLPVPQPVGVSGEMVVIPNAAVEFTAGNIPGFAEAARGLRSRLEEQ